MRKIFCRHHKKMNKKGFTLVELLVSVTIMAVIAVLLAQFVASTTGAFRRTSATSDIQESCQETLTQISNIVRNSKRLMVIKDDGKITLESVNHENKKIVLVYVEDSTDFNGRIYVDYDHGETISSVEWEEGMMPETDASLVVGNNDFLLTENVRDFEVSFATYKKVVDSDGNGEADSETIVEQKRTLDLVLSMEKNDREYTHKYKASLRNSALEGNLNELTIDMRDNTNNATDEAEGE